MDDALLWLMEVVGACVFVAVYSGYAAVERRMVEIIAHSGSDFMLQCEVLRIKE